MAEDAGGEFALRLRLASPFREGVGAELVLRERVATLGELRSWMIAHLPAFTGDVDEAVAFAVNGVLVLHGEAGHPLRSGDEVELLVAFMGG